MKILTSWLRSYLPPLPVDDAQLADVLTLRGIAVEGVVPLTENPAGEPASLFDMDITTNRVDAMNHYGIAREAAAIYNLPLHPLDAALPAALPNADRSAPFPVRIEAPDLCGRFTAQVIRNVTIAPTEGRVSQYFSALGQKSISDAVDATNFVLLGMGQPTHAFDLDRIEGGIVVRRARAGEQLQLLDGTTRTLVAEDLVVADERKPLALAGVMGGLDSMITARTRNILVEAAWFDPAAIRASSRRHLLHTDASHRFERGADFAAAPIANALVSRQILAACGGSLDGPLVDLVLPDHAARTTGRPSIALSAAEVRRHLGTTLAPEGLTPALIEQFLQALGCTLTATGDGRYQVQLPSWRLDLTREIDLIEEIARVYGYNRFANTLPAPAVVVAHPQARARHALNQRLFALGYSQTLSSTFASAADCATFAPSALPVPLENPLSEEAANLRPSLLPGMLAMLAHNLNRDVSTARLFESGAIFTAARSRPEETAPIAPPIAQVDEVQSLALGLTGKLAATPLYSPADAPFYQLKGVLESILSLFATPTPAFSSAAIPPAFEPGRAASVTLDGRPIASFGQLSTAEAARRKLRQPVFLAELDLESLLALPLRPVTARELSHFPAVERDFSFTFAESTAWQTIADALAALALPELEQVSPGEVFRDPHRLPGRFSLLIRTVFQAPDRTLTEDELNAWTAAIVHTLEQLGGILRA